MSSSRFTRGIVEFEIADHPCGNVRVRFEGTGAAEAIDAFIEKLIIPEDQDEVIDDAVRFYYEQLAEKSSEALIQHVYESVAAALLAKGVEGTSAELTDLVDALIDAARPSTKRRIGARTRGGQGVTHDRVIGAIMDKGGEDAKAKDVAAALSLSDRQLRNVRLAAGFDSWQEFVRHVVNLVQRQKRK